MTEFVFRSELFDLKGTAQNALDCAGIVWFSDYQSIDLLHEECGLEVCGIYREDAAIDIQNIMRRTFSDWNHTRCYYKDWGADIGWKVIIQRASFGGGTSTETF